MSELQLGLVSVGLAILLLVVGYNAWQRFRIRKILPRSAPTKKAAGSDKTRTQAKALPSFAPTSAVSLEVEQTHPWQDDIAPFLEREAKEPSLHPLPPSSLGEEGTYDEGDAMEAASLEAHSGIKNIPQDDSLATNSLHNEIESADRLAARLFKNTQPARIDLRIDAVVQLDLPSSVSAERLMLLAQRQRRVGNKPILLEARHRRENEAPAEKQQALPTDKGDWYSPEAGERYEQVRVAVQLANRSGALNELEFSEFVSGVRALAKTLDAMCKLPTMQHTIAHARELDAFATKCDMQLCINVRSDGAPWSAHYVQQTATQDGLVLSRDGSRFLKLDAQGKPIFMLCCGQTNFLRDDLTYSGTSMITLLLDVPIAEEEQQPFRIMQEYARSLSKHIGGHIVDDQRQSLSDAALSSIEKGLMVLYGVLEEAGLPAGAPVTRRLFSNG